MKLGYQKRVLVNGDLLGQVYPLAGFEPVDVARVHAGMAGGLSHEQSDHVVGQEKV